MAWKNKEQGGPASTDKPELEDTSMALNAKEKTELERRRRAAELEGTPFSPVELTTERAELEVLRNRGNAPVEI